MTNLTNKFLGVQFRQLAESLGYAATILLCEQLGGRERVYIPKRSDLEHPFRNIVGDEKFVHLTHSLGGLFIDVPMPPRLLPKKAAIMEDLEANQESYRTIASRHKVSARYVRRIHAELVELGILEHREASKPGYLRDSHE